MRTSTKLPLDYISFENLGKVKAIYACTVSVMHNVTMNMCIHRTKWSHNEY